ncbi:WSC-domain-containing protein [Trichocladium antarcticum]|uniref:WSC-domain-containing protein n=1 Tax=Trichocladium antarcticum TaxID=1450529 RepID=A0AAN6ZBE3_9PEZI|nr:WSC-domain-containing protein [Trichocladium antarcticum]
MRAQSATVSAWLLAFAGLARSAGSVSGSIPPWKDLGCYVDDESPPTLNNFLGTHVFQTVTQCENDCMGAGYKFAGLKQGNQCWCGNTVNRERAVDASRCDIACAGYAVDMCGGLDHLNIYENPTKPSLVPNTPTPPSPTAPTPTAPNPTAPTPGTPTPGTPTPGPPNPASPNPAKPDPPTPTPNSPNPTSPSPTPPAPNSANGFSPREQLGTLFMAQGIIFLGLVAHQYYQ